MVDVFLAISMAVALGILLVSGVYLIVYYQHPDDHNEAYFPKLVVLLGYMMAGATVLLLPLDVANNSGYAGCAGYDTKFCGGLPMEELWNAFFWMIPIWVFLAVPFSTFYYEADDGMLMAGTAYAPNPVKRSRFGQALCYQIFVLIIVGIFFTIMYLGLSDSMIPVTTYEDGKGLGTITTSNTRVLPAVPANTTFDVNNLANMDVSDYLQISQVQKGATPDTITIQVTVSTFFAGLMAWIGWFFLALFGGIGLSALPLDLILTYVHRPKHMDPAEFAEAQMSLRDRVNELVDIGELIKIEREEKKQAGLDSAFSGWSFDSEKRQAARDERQAILGFKQAVFLLEQDADDFRAHTADREKYNPLIPYVALLLGCCSIIISLFWFLQIIVYVFPDPPLAPFLNNYFKWFDGWFPLFGVLSVAIFTLYLLLCSIKGCFKFGIRFLFFHIHPMKPGKTYMSSFMFNIALVLLCAMPTVQFCQEAFADYAAYSEIRQIFGVQIQYLQFFRIFWTKNIFIYIFFCFNILTGIYLACRPNDKAASGQALRDRLRSRRG